MKNTWKELLHAGRERKTVQIDCVKANGGDDMAE
jgi:hypothetical protein